MEKFSVSVNIAAQSSVTFILTYEELLQRKLGSYEILTRVKIEQPVQEFQVGLAPHFHLFLILIKDELYEVISETLWQNDCFMCMHTCARV